jgi:CelD/BcsL family acetyltransferase involved in cellulose biosynthesis
MLPERRVRAATRPYQVEERDGRGAFAALCDEWNALLASGPADVPFARHEWIAAWLEAFAPRARLRVFVARDAHGRAAGMAPLVEERRFGLRRLVAPANDHSCRVEWVLGPDAPGALEALWAHLRDSVSWDVILLRDVPRDGPTAQLADLAAADGHPHGHWESMRSPYVSLGSRPVAAQLDAKFKANLRRRLRRLLEQGPVAVERVDGPDGVAPFLERFLALEAAGWKGRRGTAIAGDPRLVSFYSSIARSAAEGRWVALRALEMGGRPAAMHFGLAYRGTYYLPKPAYDETLAPCSPGQLLFAEVVAECEARGFHEVDFLGPDMPWKREWAPQHRPHDWLYVYRPGLPGRTLHTLRHRVRPLAREVLRWWR